MEPNQVDVVAAAVFGSFEQIVHRAKTRLARQIIGDLGDTNRHDRIYHDVSFVHAIATTHLDMGTRPDANAAPDPSASNSFAKMLGEHHDESNAMNPRALRGMLFGWTPLIKTPVSRRL